MNPASDEKGDRSNLPERPGGCSAQIGPVPFFVRQELCDLLGQLRDGEIDQSGLARLDVLVSGDAAARRLYLDYVDLCASLHWAAAEELVRRFAETHPDDPDIPRIATDLADARQAAGQDLRARIEAARDVNDPDRVIEFRDELKSLLDPDALRALDRELARWFLALISRRLRAGTARTDVAMLAARVAERLDDTPEGASLRASLPTLRRAAGLCARCGQPYAGVADACPVCLAGPRTPPIPPALPSREPSSDGPAA